MVNIAFCTYLRAGHCGGGSLESSTQCTLLSAASMWDVGDYGGDYGVLAPVRSELVQVMSGVARARVIILDLILAYVPFTAHGDGQLCGFIHASELSGHVRPSSIQCTFQPSMFLSTRHGLVLHPAAHKSFTV